MPPADKRADLVCWAGSFAWPLSRFRQLFSLLLRTFICGVTKVFAVKAFQFLTLAEDMEVLGIALAASAPVRMTIKLNQAMFAVEGDITGDIDDGGGSNLARREHGRHQGSDQRVLASAIAVREFCRKAMFNLLDVPDLANLLLMDFECNSLGS